MDPANSPTAQLSPAACHEIKETFGSQLETNRLSREEKNLRVIIKDYYVNTLQSWIEMIQINQKGKSLRNLFLKVKEVFYFKCKEIALAGKAGKPGKKVMALIAQLWEEYQASIKERLAVVRSEDTNALNLSDRENYLACHPNGIYSSDVIKKRVAAWKNQLESKEHLLAFMSGGVLDTRGVTGLLEILRWTLENWKNIPTKYLSACEKACHKVIEGQIALVSTQICLYAAINRDREETGDEEIELKLSFREDHTPKLVLDVLVLLNYKWRLQVKNEVDMIIGEIKEKNTFCIAKIKTEFFGRFIEYAKKAIGKASDKERAKSYFDDHLTSYKALFDDCFNSKVIESKQKWFNAILRKDASEGVYQIIFDLVPQRAYAHVQKELAQLKDDLLKNPKVIYCLPYIRSYMTKVVHYTDILQQHSKIINASQNKVAQAKAGADLLDESMKQDLCNMVKEVSFRIFAERMLGEGNVPQWLIDCAT